MDPVQAGLATLFASGTLTGLSDLELLERFASRGDRTAFEVLVGRHAPLVGSVCRDLLTDPNDADDAFQATFLVLARKAGSIRAGDSLASWLCRVAYRIAVRAGIETTRRRQVERRGAEHYARRTASENADRPGNDEIAILFDELDRLPERYRTPVVLCHLEGLSTEAAARRLGCPVGTIWAHLSRARARLRSRLVRRGVSLSVAGLAAAVFPPVTRAAVSSELLHTTIRSSLRYLTLDAFAAGATSVRALAWTDTALRAMLHTRLKTAAMILLAVGAIATVRAGSLRGGSGKPLSRRARLPDATSPSSDRSGFPTTAPWGSSTCWIPTSTISPQSTAMIDGDGLARPGASCGYRSRGWCGSTSVSRPSPTFLLSNSSTLRRSRFCACATWAHATMHFVTSVDSKGSCDSTCRGISSRARHSSTSPGCRASSPSTWAIQRSATTGFGIVPNRLPGYSVRT